MNNQLRTYHLKNSEFTITRDQNKISLLLKSKDEKIMFKKDLDEKNIKNLTNEIDLTLETFQKLINSNADAHGILKILNLEDSGNLILRIKDSPIKKEIILKVLPELNLYENIEEHIQDTADEILKKIKPSLEKNLRLTLNQNNNSLNSMDIAKGIERDVINILNSPSVWDSGQNDLSSEISLVMHNCLDNKEIKNSTYSELIQNIIFLEKIGKIYGLILEIKDDLTHSNEKIFKILNLLPKNLEYLNLKINHAKNFNIEYVYANFHNFHAYKNISFVIEFRNLNMMPDYNEEKFFEKLEALEQIKTRDIGWDSPRYGIVKIYHHKDWHENLSGTFPKRMKYLSQFLRELEPNQNDLITMTNLQIIGMIGTQHFNYHNKILSIIQKDKFFMKIFPQDVIEFYSSQFGYSNLSLSENFEIKNFEEIKDSKYIYFGCFQKENSRNLKNLVNQFKLLERCENLYIEFDHCDHMVNDSLNDILVNLPSSLKYLDMKLTDIHKIDDNQIKTFLESSSIKEYKISIQATFCFLFTSYEFKRDYTNYEKIPNGFIFCNQELSISPFNILEQQKFDESYVIYQNRYAVMKSITTNNRHLISFVNARRIQISEINIEVEYKNYEELCEYIFIKSVKFQNLKCMFSPLIYPEYIIKSNQYQNFQDINRFLFKAMDLEEVWVSNMLKFEIITIKEYNFDSNSLKIFLENIKLFPKILKIDLNFAYMINFDDEYLGMIAEMMNYKNEFTHLNLNFAACLLISDKGIEDMSKSLTKQSSITNLSLNFAGCFSINDRAIEILSKCLTKLSNLSLNYALCSSISDTGIEHLTKCLANLSYLTNLSLNFRGCLSLSDKGIEYLSDSLKNLSYIKTLSMDFAECSLLSDIGIEHLSKSLTNLSSMTNFSLNFGRCSSISDKGIQDLSKFLADLSTITNLSLNFAGCISISDRGLEQLSNCLTSLSSITNLYLNYWRCLSISDKGIEDLSNSIKNLSYVKNLSLNFSGCLSISDKGIEDLSKSLSNLSSIRYLSLDFAGCLSISDKSLENLSESLTKLTSITYLLLNFAICSSITDEGIKNLSKSLNNLSSITNFSLNILGCLSITDSGIINLSKYITNLSSITNLSLNFAGCLSISDRGLGHLSNCLISLSSTTNLSLKFWGCLSISDKGIKDLSNALNNLSSIKVLSMDFAGCSSKPDIFGDYVPNIFSNISFILDLTPKIEDFGKDLYNFKKNSSFIPKISLNFEIHASKRNRILVYFSDRPRKFRINDDNLISDIPSLKLNFE